MLEKQTIFRVSKNKENPYVMIDKYFFANPNLSAKAKGILGYLLSKPNNWTTILTDIVKHMKDGEKSIRSGIKELIEHKYLQRFQVRKDNKIHHIEIQISERPLEDKELIKSITLLENGNERVNYIKNIKTTQPAENTLVAQKGEVGKSTEKELNFQKNVKTAQPVAITLVAQKGEIAQPVETTLVAQKVQGGFVHVQKDVLLINDYNNKELNNKSINLSEMKKIDNDINNFEKIIKKSELEKIEPEKRKVLLQALRTLYFTKDFLKLHNSQIPISLIRKDMEEINYLTLQHAYVKFERACKDTLVKNTIAYLKICIYDSIYSIDADIQAELLNEGIIT